MEETSSESNEISLSGDILTSSLKHISKSSDGSGYAFVQLDCSGRNVTIVPETLQDFINLRYIDISDNKITDIGPFTRLQHVLAINASSNSINSLECLSDSCLPFCRVLDVSNNSLESIGIIGIPELKNLILAGNNISSLEEFTGHQNLEMLSLHHNKLQSCEHLENLPNLKQLILSENSLTSLNELGELPNLTSLNISSNEVHELSGVEAAAPKLVILRLQDNHLEMLSELQNLVSLTSLRNLDISQNPLEEELGDMFRVEVLAILDRLEILNDQPVSQEELQKARELVLQREQERKEAEGNKGDQGDESDIAPQEYA